MTAYKDTQKNMSCVACGVSCNKNVNGFLNFPVPPDCVYYDYVSWKIHLQL